MPADRLTARFGFCPSGGGTDCVVDGDTLWFAGEKYRIADIDTPEMVRILTELGFTVDGDDVTVPSWRGDVEHYSDLAEEVARFFGYNNIPTTAMMGVTTQGGYSKEQILERNLGTVCRSMGFDEIITYSFISPTYYDKIRMPEDSPLRKSMKIMNPLGEDTSIMRTTILPSMLEILTRNYNYRNKSAYLYELGRTYFEREDGLADEPMSCLWVCTALLSPSSP